MKKVITIFLVIISLFLISGCTKKEDKKNSDKKENETKILVDGIEFKFNKDATFERLSFKVDEKLPESNPYSAPASAKIRQYLYRAKETDSTYLIIIRMFYYKNKTIEQAMKDLGIEGDTTELYTVEAEHMSLKMSDKLSENGTNHIYFISDNSDIYALQIASRSDIKLFESEFLKTLEIKG